MKDSSEGDGLPRQLDFASVIEAAEIVDRWDVKGQGDAEPIAGYDPVGQTSSYMHRAVEAERSWDTTLAVARKRLQETDARALYLEFFADLKHQIESGASATPAYANLLEAVAIRGFGMGLGQVRLRSPSRGSRRWQVDLNIPAIERHVSDHVIGSTFIRELQPVQPSFGVEPIVAGSDVSQHRSAVPVPSRFFKHSVPFVLNNAAGTLYSGVSNTGMPRFENVFNPQPDESLMRWMLIDPSYQDELDPEDYERCLASAMDVGQYRFDLEYLMKAGRRAPWIIFRDGSLFPQDAYLDNYVIQSKRGDFTREAIKELLGCLTYAREVGSVYCGVSKNVQLKVYSAVLDWFITRNIDRNWGFGAYTFNDGRAMTYLLSSADHARTSLDSVLCTCMIRRGFATRANLNTRIGAQRLIVDYFDRFQAQNPEVDITPYRRLCDLAVVYMMYIGHSPSPQEQLPRYEFFCPDGYGTPEDRGPELLAGLKYCGLMSDTDHSFMADKPVRYLLPSVTQQAHLLSKDVGRYIDTATGQWIMARFTKMISR